jgi:hypothetical protein
MVRSAAAALQDATPEVLPWGSKRPGAQRTLRQRGRTLRRRDGDRHGARRRSGLRVSSAGGVKRLIRVIP